MKKSFKTLLAALCVCTLCSFRVADGHGAFAAPELENDLPRFEMESIPEPPSTATVQQQYVRLKETIKRKKRSFRDLFKWDRGRGIQESKSFLYHALNDSIFHYWYGTPWDFNGTTQEPGNGLIACGYFVTTTLRDAGIPLQRVYLAQQRAGDIINQLCKPASIKTVYSGEALQTYLDQYPDGSLLLIGLDKHVGFLSKENGKTYFIHANYLGDRTVVKEEIGDSEAIFHSSIFALGDILGNDSLLQKWILE